MIKLHSKRVEKTKTTLDTSGEDDKLHSKPVQKTKTTLETGGEDDKLHSKPVQKTKTTLETGGEDYLFNAASAAALVAESAVEVSLNTAAKNYTLNERGRFKNTLETSGEDVKIHSKRV